MMGRKRNLRRIWALALAVTLVCCGILGTVARADGEEPRTVRISCGVNDLLYLDEAGQSAGRCARYLSKLAQINNWKYEYVEGPWTQAVEKLESGELDLLFPTNYTPQRADTMDFSAMLGGYTAPGLFARWDSSYGYEDFAGFNGARIGVTRGSSNDLALAKLAQDRGFTYEMVHIASNSEKLEALAQGTVDMIVLSADNDLGNTVLVATMDAAPFYYTVKKGNETLLRELDRGMQQLLKSDPELVAETMRECLLGGNGRVLAFTPGEKKFLASGREVVVGFYDETKPLAYAGSGGICGGIYIKLLDRVRERGGINLVFRPIDRDSDWQDVVRAGQMDFFIGDSVSLAAEDPDFIATDTFFTCDNVLVTRNDCPFGELDAPVIALTNGRTYLNNYVSTTFGAGDIRFYRSAKDCLVAVLNGEADGAILNNVEYNYQSKNPRFSDLIQWENYRVTTAGGLMAAADVDPDMFSAVNKTLGTLSADFVSTTISDELNMPYDTTLSDSLYVLRHLLGAVGVACLGAVAVGLLVWRSRRRHKDVMARVQEHERHQLRILAALSRDYDAIYYTNLDGDYCEEIRVNDRAVEGAGKVTLDTHIHTEAMRQYVEWFAQPEYYEALMPLSDPRVLLQRFQESPDFSVRYQVKSNKLGQEYFELHLVDVSVPGGEHAMVFGTRCIDDVVKAEAEQRQLLQDALASAQKASDAKSDFFSKMSHDIRTPMNAIIGTTALAAAHLDDAQRVKDALDKISASGRYLLGLINEVLDMSKIESGTATRSVASQLDDVIQLENEDAKDRLQEIQASDYAGSRVLLVEDNELNREIAREILEMAGLEVEEAENGQIAVDMAKNSAPGYYRMIFMDVEMPVMTGHDAALAIRSLGRSDLLRVPIIAMTANAFVEDVQAAKTTGMNAHIAKPIDFDQLSVILKKYLA